jgi:hypothetical protein
MLAHGRAQAGGQFGHYVLRRRCVRRHGGAVGKRDVDMHHRDGFLHVVRRGQAFAHALDQVVAVGQVGDGVVQAQVRELHLDLAAAVDLDRHRNKVAHAAGKGGFFRRPCAHRADLLVADHADELAFQPHRCIEQRTDAVPVQVVAQRATRVRGAWIVMDIRGIDRTHDLQVIDVLPVHRQRFQCLGWRVPAAGADVGVDALQAQRLRQQAPGVHAFDLHGVRRGLANHGEGILQRAVGVPDGPRQLDQRARVARAGRFGQRCIATRDGGHGSLLAWNLPHSSADTAGCEAL